MICLYRKVVLLAILSITTSWLFVSTNGHIVYGQSGSSYNLTSSYIVKPGDTLSIVASRHGVSVQAIATTNSIRNINNIRVGQLLIIPSPANRGGQVHGATVPPYPSPTPYIQPQSVYPQPAPTQQPYVQPPANPYAPGAVHAGQPPVYSPPVYPAPNVGNQQGYQAGNGGYNGGYNQPPSYNPPASSCYASPQSYERTHNVRPGDTLNRIARTYGVSVSAVRQRNGLPGDRIRVGECLIVPAGSTVTPVPDRRRSSEQPPMTTTPAVTGGSRG